MIITEGYLRVSIARCDDVKRKKQTNFGWRRR
jgi:hypothetical protein